MNLSKYLNKNNLDIEIRKMLSPNTSKLADLFIVISHNHTSKIIKYKHHIPTEQFNKDFLTNENIKWAMDRIISNITEPVNNYSKDWIIQLKFQYYLKRML